MPELPEVEVTRRGIAPRLLGARIEALRLGKPLRWPLGCPPARLAGAVIRSVERRGKYLLLHLDRGLLLWHLGMSGSLGFVHGHAPPGPHDHADLVTDRGTLRLHDPRRFGAVVHATSLDAPVARRLLGRLGVEPLDRDFTPQGLHQGLRGRTAPVKQILLAGDLVVGVGNIYACEALFRAGIRPTTPGRRIGPQRAVRLHEAIRAVLAEAVERGGSTLRDFTGADGQAGHYQQQALVYGRAGEPCRQCGAAVQVLRQGQRSTYFCALCQRP